MRHGRQPAGYIQELSSVVTFHPGIFLSTTIVLLRICYDPIQELRRLPLQFSSCVDTGNTARPTQDVESAREEGRG